MAGARHPEGCFRVCYERQTTFVVEISIPLCPLKCTTEASMGGCGKPRAPSYLSSTSRKSLNAFVLVQAIQTRMFAIFLLPVTFTNKP